MSTQTLELKVGRTYRARRPAVCGDFFNPLVNDRTIVWMDSMGMQVQYDSPSVAMGRHLPRVDVDKFLRWASHDVTDLLPPDEYAPWPITSAKPAATPKDTQ